MHVELALLYQIATVLNATLNIPNSPMMTKWHHSDSSKLMSEVQESVQKKALDANSRSNWFSAGLWYDRNISPNTLKSLYFFFRMRDI